MFSDDLWRDSSMSRMLSASYSAGSANDDDGLDRLALASEGYRWPADEVLQARGHRTACRGGERWAADRRRP